MKVALFGGTFDPVHTGHLNVARAAMITFGLDQVHFVPASRPPHKQNRPLAPFAHRYAMVALACAGTPQFIPSLIESPEETGTEPNYSLVTVRKVAARLRTPDQLYFIIGADAFLDIGTWHDSVDLLDSCDFIVISRPGFPIEKIVQAIPGEMAAHDMEGAAGPSIGATAAIRLRRTTLHLLNTVHSRESSSGIRAQAIAGDSLEGMVPEAVAEYIQKTRLFTSE